MRDEASIRCGRANGLKPDITFALKTAKNSLASREEALNTSTAPNQIGKLDMKFEQGFEAALTRLPIQKPTASSIDELQRQTYCNETLKELSAMTRTIGYQQLVRPQTMVFWERQHLFSGVINFAINKNLTWVQFEYQPLGLAPLAWEIFFSESKTWDLETRANNLGKIEVPEFTSDGWNDAVVSPFENATKILGTFERMAAEVDVVADFSKFVCCSKHVSLYRPAQATSLIMDGKMDQARDLAHGLLSGELKQAGIEWYSMAHGKRFPVGELILQWFETAKME